MSQCNVCCGAKFLTRQRCYLQNPAWMVGMGEILQASRPWIVSDRKDDQPFVDWLVPHTQMTAPHCGQTHISYHIGEIHILVGFIPSFCLGISKNLTSPPWLSNWLIRTVVDFCTPLLGDCHQHPLFLDPHMKTPYGIPRSIPQGGGSIMFN